MSNPEDWSSSARRGDRNAGSRRRRSATGAPPPVTTPIPAPPDPKATPIRFALGADIAPGRVDPLSMSVRPGDSLVVTRSRFMVDGWVANPGLYNANGDTTALDSETIAGGALFPADLHRVEIVRARADGSKQVIPVDLARVAHGETTDVRLEEGDVVRFPASPIRMVPYSVYWVLKNLFPVGGGVYVPNP